MNYCTPLCAGLSSEPKAVARRLARLLNALETEITGYVVTGAILEQKVTFYRQVLEGLRMDGWRITWNDNTNKWKVLAPK